MDTSTQADLATRKRNRRRMSAAMPDASPTRRRRPPTTGAGRRWPARAARAVQQAALPLTPWPKAPRPGRLRDGERKKPLSRSATGAL